MSLIVRPMRELDVFERIAEERRRQDLKWGELPIGRSFYQWMTILGEEFGECCEAALEYRMTDGPASALKEELIQVAAVAISIVVDIEHFETK